MISCRQRVCKLTSILIIYYSFPLVDQNLGNFTFTEFFDGFVHGLQKYENQTSQCGNNLGKIQTIIDGAVKIYRDFIAGKLNPTAFMAFLYSSWSVINLIEDTCHLYELITDTIALLNPIALVLRLVYVVFIGSFTILPSSFYFLYYLFQGDSYMSGLHMGRILKVALQYEME